MNSEQNYEIIGIEEAAKHIPPRNHSRRARIEEEHAELINQFNEMQAGMVLLIHSSERHTLERLRTDIRAAQNLDLLNAPIRTYLRGVQDHSGFILGIFKLEADKDNK